MHANVISKKKGGPEDPTSKVYRSKLGTDNLGSLA